LWDEVVHVGEPLAIVVANNRYVAEDAAALVDVEYDIHTRRGYARRLGNPRPPFTATRRTICSPIRCRLWRRRGGVCARRMSFMRNALAASRRRPFHQIRGAVAQSQWKIG
jgi:CO/xanthine dehydrogenase Mo-binding subunit